MILFYFIFLVFYLILFELTNRPVEFRLERCNSMSFFCSDGIMRIISQNPEEYVIPYTCLERRLSVPKRRKSSGRPISFERRSLVEQ
jgi:hypothetical protein